MFLQACTSAGQDPAACTLLANDISQSMDGNLARRPAAMCYRMGACIAERMCNGTISNNGTLVTVPLDTCSATGLLGGPLVGTACE
jgi:hypothetical protein